MLIDAVRRCLLRDLASLDLELQAYPDDAAVWALPAGAPNSAGTLVQHLAGNLRHFIGATLGTTGYLRDRDAEFALRDVPRTELRALLAATMREVDVTLSQLDAARLDEPYPVAFPVGPFLTGRFLVHLATHLGYHLGQVDYHRRLVTGDAGGVGAMGVGPLI